MVAGRFRIGKLLGRGGMGEVFEAHDRSLDDQVALKVVKSRTVSAESLQRLRREVLLARRVTHGNVCRIFDLIQHRDEKTGEDLALVSMELLEGETLRDRFGRLGVMPVDQVLPIVRQIARGLIAAHRLNIVHRDLKPANVMLIEEPGGLRVAITDFGLARSVGRERPKDPDLTQEGHVLGTPAYMAPEQVAGESTSPATDIYSLGVMLYELLTGNLPFSGSSPWRMAIARLTDAPKPLSEVRPDLDPALLKLVERCLQRSPELRFSSAASLLEPLDFGDSSWDLYGRKSGDAGHTGPPRSWDAQEEPEPAPDAPARASRRWWPAALLLILWLGLAASWWSSGRSTSRPTAAPVGEEDWGAIDDTLRDLPELPNEGGGKDGPAAASEDPSEALQQATRFLERDDGARARLALEPALRAHPQDPRLLGALAQASWREGREIAARDLLGRALGASSFSKLPPRERALLECLNEGMGGDWRRARERLSELLRGDPTFAEAGLWLAEATWLSGWVEDTPGLFDALRKQIGDDPRIAVWQSWNIRRLGDFARQRELASAAALEAQRLEAPFLELEALRSQARALRSMGRNLELGRVVERFDKIAGELQQPVYLARALTENARVLDLLGEEDEALEKLLAVKSIYEEIGSYSGQCLSHQIFALLHNIPDLQASYLENAVDYCRLAGMPGGEALALYQLARSLRNRGDFTRAAELFQQSSAQMESLNSGEGIALNRIGLAFLFGRMGRFEGMKKNLLSVEPWFIDKDDAEKLTVTLLGLSLASLQLGDLDAAVTYLDRAEFFEPKGARLLDLQEMRCAVAYETGEAAKLRRISRRFRELSGTLSRPGSLAKAQAFEAIVWKLEGDPERSLLELRELEPATSRGLIFWIDSLLESGSRGQEARRAIAALRARATEDRQQVDLWHASLFEAVLTSGTDQAAAAQRLIALERVAADQGAFLVDLHAKIWRGSLTQDRALLLKAADEAEVRGYARLATLARSRL
ncbi:MAG: protein kinase [Acidobacteriota bacterium]